MALLLEGPTVEIFTDNDGTCFAAQLGRALNTRMQSNVPFKLHFSSPTLRAEPSWDELNDVIFVWFLEHMQFERIPTIRNGAHAYAVPCKMLFLCSPCENIVREGIRLIDSALKLRAEHAFDGEPLRRSATDVL